MHEETFYCFVFSCTSSSSHLPFPILLCSFLLHFSSCSSFLPFFPASLTHFPLPSFFLFCLLVFLCPLPFTIFTLLLPFLFSSASFSSLLFPFSFWLPLVFPLIFYLLFLFPSTSPLCLLQNLSLFLFLSASFSNFLLSLAISSSFLPFSCAFFRYCLPSPSFLLFSLSSIILSYLLSSKVNTILIQYSSWYFLFYAELHDCHNCSHLTLLTRPVKESIEAFRAHTVPRSIQPHCCQQQWHSLSCYKKKKFTSLHLTPFKALPLDPLLYLPPCWSVYRLLHHLLLGQKFKNVFIS